LELAVDRLVNVRGDGSDIDQAGDAVIRASRGDDRASVRVAD
jgi:hypothetical protein